jgi:denticleless
VLRGRVDPAPAHVFSYAGASRRVHGYTSLVVDSASSRLFASCTDDIIYAYDLLSYK